MSEAKKKLDLVESTKKYFHDFKIEFKKIVWPTRELLIKNTTTVLIAIALFGTFIAILDAAFSSIVVQMQLGL